MSGQLDLGQQPGATAVLELVVQRRGQVEHRPRVQHLGLTDLTLTRSGVTHVEAELSVVDRTPA